MKGVLKKFLADESGATAIEHGMIAAGISLAIRLGRERARHQSANQIHVDQYLAALNQYIEAGLRTRRFGVTATVASL